MESRIIDDYNYCSNNAMDISIRKFYNKKKYTKEELEKTKSIRKKICDFKKVVNGVDEEVDLEKIVEYTMGNLEENIHYLDEVGYISSVNADRGNVDVYFYGKTEEEAFITVMIDWEFRINVNYEANNRDELNKDYSERFLDGNVSDDDYHGPFFFAELSLQDFRRYYGDNMPEELVSYYEKYISGLLDEELKYDYENDCLVRAEKTLRKVK